MLEGTETQQTESVSKYGSKMGKIVEIIQDIIDKEGFPKILVYSQWEDSLHLLSQILMELKIPCIFMTRKDNYASTVLFKTNPNIAVFLLLLQQGNNGLDMSIATHIIIMEPILSASISMIIVMIYSDGSTGS